MVVRRQEGEAASWTIVIRAHSFHRRHDGVIGNRLRAGVARAIISSRRATSRAWSSERSDDDDDDGEYSPSAHAQLRLRHRQAIVISILLSLDEGCEWGGQGLFRASRELIEMPPAHPQITWRNASVWL